MIWNLHSHSKFSYGDALPDVKDMVKTVHGYGQQALGLTDHGNMAGTVQLYNECAKLGLSPFPGTELYVVHSRADKKAKRHHMCVVAYTTEGYKNLVNLSTLSHKNFFNKPLVDNADLAELSEAGLLKGIAATSGCYFGFTAQAVVSGNTENALSYMYSYSQWFDRFYVELQNHNIVHEEEGWDDNRLADALMGLANQAGIPMVLTQDSHYCHLEDKPVHETLKEMVAFGPTPDEAVFPGDGFHLADEEWLRAHHHAKRFAAGEEGLNDLLDAHDLCIEQLDKYHYNIPFTVADPDTTLSSRTASALHDRSVTIPPKRLPEYQARLEDELAIIKDTGMAGYLLLLQEVTNWCRSNKIFYQARGSASGSMVCWLLNITQEDPLKWGLSFERFISRDRTKPPDIDLDVESNRRKDLIEWLKSRYTVTQIGTWMEFSLHSDDDEEAKGSLRVRYFSSARKQGKEIKSWADVPEHDQEMLERLSSMKSYASAGTHAAGLVVTTTDAELYNLVPMMWIASSGTMVTQYDMKDVEKLGLVKLDALGVKTLDVLHRCMDNMNRNIFEGLSWIPMNDTKTLRAISRGDTAGVFQLEGHTAARGCRQLRPTNVRDIIAAMALFRPATMKSGATDSYINRKHGEEDRPKRHPIIDKVTDSTYGIMLFQEQVISVLRALGMTADDLTDFLKAVKASNQNVAEAVETIGGYKQQIKDSAIDADFTRADWEWLWGAIEGFAEYGFNQAHSTVYGLTAYRCAYLATHHPLEFYAALLSMASSQKVNGKPSKESVYLETVRSKGIPIRRADINISGVSYTHDPRKNVIRKGLSSVKGVGDGSAQQIIDARPEGGYQDVVDFCRRVDRRKVTGVKPFIEEQDPTVGVFGKLYEAGVFDSIMES